MANTPYNNVGSQDILSAHINGLASGIGNIEKILDLKTEVATNLALSPLNDMSDIDLKHRIYEGSVRNWLSTPTPIVKKNGLVVNEGDYSIQEGFGVVVFNNQLTANDVVTVDVTYVKDASNKIEQIENDIVALQGNPGVLAPPQSIFQHDKAYLTHSKSGYLPKSVCASIGSASNSIELFPLFVRETTTVNEVSIRLSADHTATTAWVMVGIYNDNGSNYPGSLRTQTGKITCSTANTSVVGQLDENVGEVTLQPGLHWMAIYYSSAIKVDGIQHYHAQEIVDEVGFKNCSGTDNLNSEVIGKTCAIRLTNLVFGTVTTSLPVAFPTSTGFDKVNFMYLGRVGYCSPLLKVKQS